MPETPNIAAIRRRGNVATMHRYAGLPVVVAALAPEERDALCDEVDCLRAALADLIDAARGYMTIEDVGDEWREHARCRFVDALDALDADR